MPRITRHRETLVAAFLAAGLTPASTARLLGVSHGLAGRIAAGEISITTDLPRLRACGRCRVCGNVVEFPCRVCQARAYRRSQSCR